jgi:hypothetical protein
MQRAWSISAVFLLISVGCADAGADSALAELSESAPSNPLAGAAPLREPERDFDGVVRQRLPAGGYAYLQVQGPDSTRWVATMGGGEAPGTAVHVRGLATREDFHSRRLHRRFERVVFGIVEARS